MAIIGERTKCDMLCDSKLRGEPLLTTGTVYASCFETTKWARRAGSNRVLGLVHKVQVGSHFSITISGLSVHRDLSMLLSHRPGMLWSAIRLGIRGVRGIRGSRFYDQRRPGPVSFSAGIF